jgi:hypothetical protein
MKSTIVIIVLVFAVLGLLLGFAESTKVDDVSNSGLTGFAKYRFDPGRLEINTTDSVNDLSE